MRFPVLLAGLLIASAGLLPSASAVAPAGSSGDRAALAQKAVSPAIVLFYKFDTDTTAVVTDASTYALNGTLTNASPSTAYVAGLAGKKKALKLVASSRQYVSVPQSNALDVNRFTLAALVRYTGVQTSDTLDRWEVLEKAGAYWLNIRTDGHIRAGGFFGGCANARFWKYFDSAGTVPTDTWAHVAATYNGSKLTIYINGVASGSFNVTGTTCSNDEPLAVGAKNAPAKGLLEAFWDGLLDDVRVYNRPLTATQVAALVP
jgi:hypothetical protein